MREVPNDIVKTLQRTLPVIMGSIDVKKADNRLYNAIRQTKKIVERLKKIENGKYCRNKDQ